MSEPVWSWREAVVKSDMPAQAKLLCLTIGLDVSELGRFSQRTRSELSRFTSLPIRTIERYSKVIEQAGFLRLQIMRNRSGHVCGMRYFPRFPDTYEQKKEAEEILTARAAVRQKPNRQNRQPDRQSGGQILRNDLPRTLFKNARGAREAQPIDVLIYALANWMSRGDAAWSSGFSRAFGASPGSAGCQIYAEPQDRLRQAHAEAWKRVDDKAKIRCEVVTRFEAIGRHIGKIEVLSDV